MPGRLTLPSAPVLPFVLMPLFHGRAGIYILRYMLATACTSYPSGDLHIMSHDCNICGVTAHKTACCSLFMLLAIVIPQIECFSVCPVMTVITESTEINMILWFCLISGWTDAIFFFFSPELEVLPLLYDPIQQCNEGRQSHLVDAAGQCGLVTLVAHHQARDRQAAHIGCYLLCSTSRTESSLACHLLCPLVDGRL